MDDRLVIRNEEDLSSSIFIGRENELNLLTKHLVYSADRLAIVTGQYGTGKTALVTKFFMCNENFFLGGIYRFYYSELPTISELILRDVPVTKETCLIVIDDVVIKDLAMFEEQIRLIQSERPKSKIVLISRPEIPLTSINLNLHLDNLSYRELKSLTYEFIETQNSSLLEELIRLTGSNTNAFLTLLNILKNKAYSLEDIVKYLTPMDKHVLLDPNGNPLSSKSPGYKQIVVDVKFINENLIKDIKRDPSTLYQLSPREFEKVVAELLSKMGYKISLTKETRDGGKDMYAAKKDSLGSFLYVVECKRYSKDNKVNVGIVRHLYGVVSAEKATAGILATTSYFTKAAVDFQKTVPNQVSLQDYLGIQKWLAQL